MLPQAQALTPSHHYTPLLNYLQHGGWCCSCHECPLIRSASLMQAHVTWWRGACTPPHASSWAYAGDARQPTCIPHLQAGLGVAVQYANELGVDWIWERVQQLAAELRSNLRCIPGVTVHDRGRLLCGIVSFTKVGLPERAPCPAMIAMHRSDASRFVSPRDSDHP